MRGLESLALGHEYSGPMVTRIDTIIVGGGAMGSAAAWQMAARGRDVTLLERFSPGHALGSSHGASRNFSVGYSDPGYVGMLVEARRLWRELEAEFDVSLLELVGIVNHGANPNYDGMHKALAVVDMPTEFLPAAEAEKRWPGIRFDGRVLYMPEAGRLNAEASVNALQAAARARGADIRYNTPVTRLDVLSDDRVRVITDDEVFEARRAIVTVGAWTSKLVAGIVPLPSLVVTDAQTAHFEVLDPAVHWPGFNHVPNPADTSYDYWISPIYGLLTPGEGVKVGWHGSGPVVDPDSRNFDADPAQLTALAQYARDWLPGVDADRFSFASCTSTTTPDSNFVLASSGPVAVGAGFSGHGFKFTPAIGRILADLSDGSGPAPRLESSPWP